MNEFTYDGGVNEAESEARRLALSWRASKHSSVIESLCNATANRAFSALAICDFMDQMDPGERADLLSMLSAKLTEINAKRHT